VLEGVGVRVSVSVGVTVGVGEWVEVGMELGAGGGVVGRGEAQDEMKITVMKKTIVNFMDIPLTFLVGIGKNYISQLPRFLK
jgi:hypothetical protein